MTGPTSEDGDMAKNEETTNPNAEAEAEDNTQVADAGVPGQIQYPDREVDAEHAAAYAGGKEEFLYEDPDDPRNETWENPADRRTTEQRRADAEGTEDDTDE